MKSNVRIALFLCLRMLLGAIFIAASIDKILHPAEFAGIVHNYQILPDNLINIVAIVLPWLEAILGLFILIGFWLPGATALANLFLVAFLSALIYNIARGIDIHCGCFSTKVTGEPHTAWYLVRDTFFLMLGSAVMIRVFRSRSANSASS